MRILILFITALCMGLSVQGAWYWPFGTDEDDPAEPKRLHRLLEEANNFIEMAEEAALDGQGDKAIEHYKSALAELDRVEKENPDRASTAEFSPLRNKRATCQAAIDSIRFDQVDQNERAISVTDTTELERKWRKKHGLSRPEDLEKEKADLEKEKKKADATGPTNAPPAGVSAVTNQPPAQAAVSTNAPPREAAAAPKPKMPDAVFAARMKTALTEVRNKDYAAADLLLEKLAAERPNDLNVLLLQAAAQSGTGSRYAARRTLEKAMRAHPKSYLPYYNLAFLLLKMEEDVETARQYYEMGRMVGGAPQPALEALLNQKGK